MLQYLKIGVLVIFLEETPLSFIDAESTVIIFGFDIYKAKFLFFNHLCLVSKLVFLGHNCS